MPAGGKTAQNPDEFERARRILQMDTTINQSGILIRLEGLIAYSVLADKKRDDWQKVCLEVDALLMDPLNRETSQSPSPPHEQTIGIPRDMIVGNPKATAVDSKYAYFAISGKTLSLGVSHVASNVIHFDQVEPNADRPSNDDAWKSTGWIMDLDKLYPGYVHSGYQPAATVKFAKGAVFEPSTLVYGADDRAKYMWEIYADGQKTHDHRAYKYSTHAFYGLPNTGRLTIHFSNDGGTVTVKPGLHGRPIRIANLPIPEQSVGEMQRNEDAKVYAELFRAKSGDKVPDSARKNPGNPRKLDPPPGLERSRHEDCQCCLKGRFLRIS